MNLISLQFKWINFQFCGIGEATELGETVQNFTKWCNLSTKVISKTKLLTRGSLNHKNSFLQKHDSCNGLPRPYPMSIPVLNCKETALKLNYQNTEIS